MPTLNSVPAVQTGLRLCPSYNLRATCCTEAFEHSQAKHYSFFKDTILPSLLGRVARHRESVKSVMTSQVYAASSLRDREQHGRAVARFSLVLHDSVFKPCFNKMLEYVAGMTCFACKSDWIKYVTLNPNVVRVHISPDACTELWEHCGAFGEAARGLRQSLTDSLLAKQAERPVTDLSMFNDQQALCDWLHDDVALHPFRWPTEMELETKLAAPVTMLQSSQATSIDDSMETRRLAEVIGVRELEVLQEGRLSTFVTYGPVSSTAGPWRRCGSALRSFLWLWLLVEASNVYIS